MDTKLINDGRLIEVATKSAEDLTFLYTKLSKHPSLILDQKKRTQFDELYDQELACFYAVVPTGQNKSEEPAELIDAMTRLTVFFHDGHTNIALPV